MSKNPVAIARNVHLTTAFLDEEVDIFLSEYMDGSGNLALFANSTCGEPMAVMTVNVPNYAAPAGHVVIKDYSENEGMMYALVVAGVIAPPKETVQVGFAEGSVCKLLLTEEVA